MSDLSQEFRAKVTDEMHRVFHGICMANGEDAATCIRRLIQEHIDKEVHRHILMSRVLKGEGVLGESQGSDPK